MIDPCQQITPDVMCDILGMPDAKAETILFERLRKIDDSYRLSYAEVGQICIQVQAYLLHEQHIDPETIEKLTALCTENNAVFARVTALNPDGRPSMIYCGTERPVGFFFCGAMKASLWKIHQMSEDFIEPSYDDDEFADRLKKSGIEFVFSTIEVHHQWHQRIHHDESISRAIYMSKKAYGVRAQFTSIDLPRLFKSGNQ